MEIMKVIWIAMCVLSTLGILSQVWIVHIIQKARQGSPLTKQIDLKYATCRKLDVQINNIQAFVGKMIDNYRAAGLPLRIIASFVEVCAYSCVLLGLLGMYLLKGDTTQMVTVAGLGFACFCMLRVVAIMVDGKEGLLRLQLEIVDSLENYGRGIEMQGMEKEPVAKKKFSRSAESEFNKMNKSFDKIMQQNKDKVIMEVLEEYL
ncbi:MAG: hypothetical protein ACI4EV_01475 [Lachnospiraceae bacterium]